MFTAETANGEKIEYVDRKRYLWLLSFVPTLIAPATIAIFYATGQNPLAVLFPVVYIYLFIPLVDLAVGEDPFNPPAEIAEKMAEDQFYRRLAQAAVPAFYLSFFAAVWLVGAHDLPFWAILLAAFAFVAAHGDVLTVSHELGHKNNKTDQRFAQVMNAMIGYGHFCIEHNRGHHVWVATPEDPASSRMGESVYAFAGRELPGTFKRGWRHEAERLSRRGKKVFSHHNEILQGYALTLVVAIAIIALFGWKMLPFLLIHHFFGWYALTQANYVEHYGLKRQKRADGKYEKVEPRHSWNTNHTVSNLMLFHLQRHSDHHANALRPYQALRNFPDLPQLPSGYPGCYGLAAIPSLWFKVMDPKVMDWADGDLSKVNICPRAEARLRERYGSPAPVAAE